MYLLYTRSKYLIFLMLIIISISFLQCGTDSVVFNPNIDDSNSSQTNQITPPVVTDSGKVFIKVAVADFDIEYINIQSLSIAGVDLSSILTAAGTDFFEHQLSTKYFQLQFSAEIKNKNGDVTSTFSTNKIIGDEIDLTEYDLAQYNYYWDVVLFVGISNSGIFVDTFSSLKWNNAG